MRIRSCSSRRPADESAACSRRHGRRRSGPPAAPGAERVPEDPSPPAPRAVRRDRRSGRADGRGRRPLRAPFGSAPLVALALAGLLSACASAPLVESGGLTSYAEMTPSNGIVTKSRIHLEKAPVLAAKTVAILPTVFPPQAAPKLSNKQRELVANAVARGLCIGLSDRFKVVTPDEPADLVVRTAVTQATETNEVAAGVSAVASLGTSFIDFGAPVPIPIPRIPIGLGSLSIEAEAIDANGRQQAGMLWARGAGAFFSSPKASKASDAYDLAESFGEDFAALLVKGKSPFEGVSFDVPSFQKLNSAAGLAPKYAACERFGRAPGVGGFVGGQLGLPPEWTDGGAKQGAPPAAPVQGQPSVRERAASAK